MENIENKTQEIDFSSKDFEKTQEVLKSTAKLNTLIKDETTIKNQKNEVMNQAIKEDNDDIIQQHLDKFETYKELEDFLQGDLKDEEVAKRINSFFTNDETGDVLELNADDVDVKSEIDELDFKRGMLLYFKQTDYYTAQIDKEIEELNRATAEITSEIADALDPLKDNILAYAEYLEQESGINDNDSVETIRKKRDNAKKAKAIKSGYTLDNLIELIEKHPNIKNNALADFKNEDKVKNVGKKYAAKLKTAKIDFNLFGLLSDDVHDSLEYRCLPLGEYPEGLENFTVFFIIRSMSMGLTTKEDMVFHASVQVCLNRLMEGSLDEEIADRVKTSITKFLNLFA